MVAAPTMSAGCVSKAYWDGDGAVANWQAEPYHCGGTQDNLNGGIIASLIDCHSLNLAIAHAYRASRAADRQRAAHRLRDGELAGDLCETDADRSTPRATSAHRQIGAAQGLGELYAQRRGGSTSDRRSVRGAGGVGIKDWVQDVQAVQIVQVVRKTSENVLNGLNLLNDLNLKEELWNTQLSDEPD